MGKIKLSKTARFILESPEKGYLRRDAEGKLVETIEDMFARVCDKMAEADLFYGARLKQAEKTAETFYKTLSQLDFLPTTYVLRHAGREINTFFACMVMPLEDDLGAIYETMKDQAVVQRGGMGVGYDFSKLRPAGDIIRSTGKVSSGPVSFMRLFDFSSEVIQNNGSFKHAAHMGVLRVDHPDIDQFIEIKKDNRELTNFNISVAITDEFMQAYEKDAKFGLRNPRNGEVVKRISAKKLFREIAKGAWQSAEPGLVFINEVNRKNQTPGVGLIDAVNLCGEQPLHHYETCTLGSINVNNFEKRGDLDWKRLEKVTAMAVHFMDNAIDLSWYLDKRSEEINKANRRIGLGVVGWSDLLIKLGIRYGSSKSLKLAEKIMKFINEKAFDASVELARQRGNFYNYDKSIYGGKVKYMRNCARTTIAPTGHLSLIAGVNSGIEPYFSFVYERKNMETMGNKTLLMVNESLESKLKKRGLRHKSILKKIAQTGTLQDLDEIPDEIKEVYVTAMDVAPIDHVKMQAAFQKHVDNGVSKTINLPQSAVIDDIEEVYYLAYKLKCKGITVYRDKSRDAQVLSLT